MVLTAPALRNFGIRTRHNRFGGGFGFILPHTARERRHNAGVSTLIAVASGENGMELFVSDLDGTLLNSQKVLSKKTVSLLNHLLEQGLQFTVATARSFESAQHILAPLHLSLPIVLFNGVFVYDPQQRRHLVSQFLPKTVVEDVLACLASHSIQPLVYTQDVRGESHVYYTGIRNHSEDRYITDRLANGDTRFRVVSSFQQALAEQVITINAIDSQHVLDPLVHEVRHTFPVNPHYAEDLYAPGYYWLEMTHPQATKQHGVQFLKTHLGATCLVCFGDHLNDLPMFHVADEAYAVKNAHEAVKHEATGMILSNDEHGVALYLAQRKGITPQKILDKIDGTGEMS